MEKMTLIISAYAAHTMIDSFVMSVDDIEIKDGKPVRDVSLCDFAAAMGITIEGAIDLSRLAEKYEECRYRFSAAGFIFEKK